MHIDAGTDSSATLPPGVPWYRLLTRYHWFVFIVAALGWVFDCLDQQLFVLARPAAMADLLSPEQQSSSVWWGNVATSVFMAGWASGGLFFGILGDRIGRTKTMMITILIYSICTGLSALSTSVYDFAFYRFLTGLGVGGEFAVGVALVAEAMPSAARPYCLATLQSLSAIGNISAALINLGLGLAEGEGFVKSPWRVMFMIGALPALLALVVRLKLKEPEAWQRASHDDAVEKRLGSYSELLGHPTWRRHALLGLILACAGVIGLWGIGFYTMDLIRYVRTPDVTAAAYDGSIAKLEAEGKKSDAESLRGIREAVLKKQPIELSEEQKSLKAPVDQQIRSKLSIYPSFASIAINFGAMFGMYGFGALSQRIGRRPTFVIALLAAFISTLTVFFVIRDFWHIVVLVPIMGFCQLSLFAGYAIYLPELFPTRLRSTGTSFCYNVGRFLAATGPLVKGWLDEAFKTSAEPLRYPGMTMCGVFLIGLLVLPFLPETKGKPLPE